MADPVWMKAIARRKKIGKDDLAFGNTTSVASRITKAPAPPRGTDLASDAKNIKIRRIAEDIPEARVDRPAGRMGKKKSKSAY